MYYIFVSFIHNLYIQISQPTKLAHFIELEIKLNHFITGKNTRIQVTQIIMEN